MVDVTKCPHPEIFPKYFSGHLLPLTQVSTGPVNGRLSLAQLSHMILGWLVARLRPRRHDVTVFFSVLQ